MPVQVGVMLFAQAAAQQFFDLASCRIIGLDAEQPFRRMVEQDDAPGSVGGDDGVADRLDHVPDLVVALLEGGFQNALAAKIPDHQQGCPRNGDEHQGSNGADEPGNMPPGNQRILLVDGDAEFQRIFFDVTIGHETPALQGVLADFHHAAFGLFAEPLQRVLVRLGQAETDFVVRGSGQARALLVEQEYLADRAQRDGFVERFEEIDPDRGAEDAAEISSRSCSGILT